MSVPHSLTARLAEADAADLAVVDMSYRLSGRRVEQGGAPQIDVDEDALARAADIMGLQLAHHRLLGEPEGRVAARSRGLDELDRNLDAPISIGRRSGRGPSDMLGPQAQYNLGAVGGGG